MTAPKTFPEPHPYTDKPRPAITLSPVESSQVKAVGYDAATNTLAVQFKHGAGAIYHYSGVSPELHQAFIGAESMGKFHGQHIKPLPFEKFPAEPEPEAEQSDVQAAAGGMSQTAVEV